MSDLVDTPVELLQNAQEFSRLLDLYHAKAPMHVLEIGTGAGGSLYHWLRHAEPGTLVVVIDDRHRNAHLYYEWTPKDVTLIPIMGSSHDRATIAEANEHAPFDWIFIDADHHEQAVRHDWHVYRRMAAPGSVIALHDISPSTDPTIEVAPLWAELERDYATVTIAEHGAPGIGVVYVPALVTVGAP